MMMPVDSWRSELSPRLFRSRMKLLILRGTDLAKISMLR